jgi:hypothetical protein
MKNSPHWQKHKHTESEMMETDIPSKESKENQEYMYSSLQKYT